MNETRRFEDTVSIHDLMNLPDKELMAKIYIQTLKTNGTVRKHEDDIECLQKEMKDKIGWKMFTVLTGVISFLIILFNILNLIME